MTTPETQARFKFGENWTRFLTLVDESRIARAESSLHRLLDPFSLSGKSFLDIGSGSGLFSLAAARLGAAVRSFDYDAQSVACAEELKRRYRPSAEWKIEQGSVLDNGYVASLGAYDIVYSWGVLHHTGAMWQAIENAAARVKSEGRLVLALYNDQGPRSRGWLAIKTAFNRFPKSLQPVFAGAFFLPLWGPTLFKDFAKGRPFQTYRSYASPRGMSPWRDLVDWVGGLPFEVAAPQAVIEFCQARGFELLLLEREQGYGCNEFVFQRIKAV